MILIHSARTGSGAHAASCSVNTVVVSPGVMRPEFEVDPSPPFSAEVQNEWSYISSPPIHLRGVDRRQLHFYVFQYKDDIIGNCILYTRVRATRSCHLSVCCAKIMINSSSLKLDLCPLKINRYYSF